MYCFLELCHSEDPSVGEGQCCSKWLSKTQWVWFIAFTPRHLRGAEVWWLSHQWTLNWAIWVLFWVNTCFTVPLSTLCHFPHSVLWALLVNLMRGEKGGHGKQSHWLSVALCSENWSKFWLFGPHAQTQTCTFLSASTFVHWHITEIPLYLDRMVS